MEALDYRINAPLSTDQFITLLNTSTLGDRRPVEDVECMEGMLANSNLIITAWADDVLVGVARSVTDFHYACYLSDIAVDAGCQEQGIGKRMLALTQAQLGPQCKLILIAAPKANHYYEALGFTANERCWVLEPDQLIVGA